jgi:hypothetical protein
MSGGDILRSKLRWGGIALSTVLIILAIIIFTAVAFAIHPPSNVETVDPAPLHLRGEFIKSNLGTTVGGNGAVIVRIVATQFAFLPQCAPVPADKPVTIRMAAPDVLHGILFIGTLPNDGVGLCGKLPTAALSSGSIPPLASQTLGGQILSSKHAMDVLLTPTDPQAAATIAAAHITAEATLRAALVQAVAAAGAIAAGALAYFGAVRQVRLQERAHEARAVAYRFRLSKVVREYLAQVETAYAAARRQFDTPDTQAPITSLFTHRPRTLHDNNWEAHALLGPRAVELILVIDDASLRLAKFDAEIKHVNVTIDAHFQGGTLAPSTGTAEGPVTERPITYAPKRAIVDYVEVLEQLRRALVELQGELAKPLGGSPWRRFRHVAMLPRAGR